MGHLLMIGGIIDEKRVGMFVSKWGAIQAMSYFSLSKRLIILMIEQVYFQTYIPMSAKASPPHARADLSIPTGKKMSENRSHRGQWEDQATGLGLILIGLIPRCSENVLLEGPVDMAQAAQAGLI